MIISCHRGGIGRRAGLKIHCQISLPINGGMAVYQRLYKRTPARCTGRKILRTVGGDYIMKRNNNVRKRRTLIPESSSNVRMDNAKHELSIVTTFEEGVRLLITDNKKRGLSEHTNDYYSDNLHVYSKFITDILNEPCPVSPNKRHTEAFLSYRINTLGKSLNACNIVLRAVKRYSAFMYAQGFSKQDELSGFKLAKNRDVEIAVFSDMQVRRMLSACDVKTFVGYRDYVLLMILLDTGVRLRELTDIMLTDVSIEDSYVRVFGKNQTYRHIPLSSTMKKALAKYLTVRGDSPSEHLFVSQDDTPLSKRGVQDRLTKYGKLAGIENVRVSPHTFRHTFATNYVKSGGDIFVLQTILGHSTLEMVRKYVRLYSPDLQRDHSKHSPLSRL